MAKQMEQIIAKYKQVAQNSTPVSGRILSWSEGIVNISSRWSQRNIERKANVQSEMFQVVNTSTKEVNTLTSTDVTSEILTSYSPSSKYRGLFREIPASGKSPKKQHLEVWERNKLQKVYDLTALDVHGDVNTEGKFGCFQWSPYESKILYVAEKKQPKSEPFLPKKASDKPDDETKKGTEYDLVEEWGEQLVGKSTPVWCVCDLKTDEIISSANGFPKDICVGQVVWAPDGGIVGVAFPTEPRRLGLMFCTNRNSYIFHFSPDSVFRKLSKEGAAVRSPTFSPDGNRLIWLERDAGGPHHACFRLMQCDWSTGQVNVVIDIVNDEARTSNNQPFYGLYNEDLGRCFISNNKIVLSTPQRASIMTFMIDLDSKEITSLSVNDDSFNLSLLDAKDNFILCSKSSLDSSPSLLLGFIKGLTNTEWITLVEQEPLISNVNVGVLRLEAKCQPNPVSKYSALYMVPKDISNGAFIVWSHGGPHSAFTNGTSVAAAFFASLGFGMVMTNYRGSIGSGQSSVDFLPGKIGETDIADSKQAAEEVLKMFPDQLSPEKCVLFGGSHGGFISLHLAAQFPSSYKSVAALNPVADMISFSSSDIPDWGMVESGYDYDPTGQITADMFEKMKALSPLTRVSAVTAPIIFMLGKKDLRVPLCHGMNFYYQLKARGVKTRVLLYDDNHSLSQLPHEIDWIINTALWYADCLGSTVQ